MGWNRVVKSLRDRNLGAQTNVDQEAWHYELIRLGKEKRKDAYIPLAPSFRGRSQFPPYTTLADPS